MLDDSTKIILIVALVIGFALVSLPVRAKLAVSNLLSPILLFPANITNSILTNFYFLRENLTRATQRSNELALENALLREKLTMLGDSTMASMVEFDLFPAQVIARDLVTMNHYLFVDKGSANQVSIGMPVVHFGWIVCSVTAVNGNRSTVETILRPGFHISSKIKRSGVFCMTSATIEGLLANYVLKDADIVAGDTIITSGLSEVFPPGINVAVVVRLAEDKDMFFKKVHLKPTVDISKLQRVYLIVPKARSPAKKIFRDPFDKLAPKMPTFTRP